MLRRRIFGILGIEFLEFSDSPSEHRLDDLILNAWLDLYAGIYIIDNKSQSLFAYETFAKYYFSFSPVSIS